MFFFSISISSNFLQPISLLRPPCHRSTLESGKSWDSVEWTVKIPLLLDTTFIDSFYSMTTIFLFSTSPMMLVSNPVLHLWAVIEHVWFVPVSNSPRFHIFFLLSLSLPTSDLPVYLMLLLINDTIIISLLCPHTHTHVYTLSQWQISHHIYIYMVFYCLFAFVVCSTWFYPPPFEHHYEMLLSSPNEFYISDIVWFLYYEVLIRRKFRELESRMEITRSWEEVGKRSLVSTELCWGWRKCFVCR